MTNDNKMSPMSLLKTRAKSFGKVQMRVKTSYTLKRKINIGPYDDHTLNSLDKGKDALSRTNMTSKYRSNINNPLNKSIVTENTINEIPYDQSKKDHQRAKSGGLVTGNIN